MTLAKLNRTPVTRLSQEFLAIFAIFVSFDLSAYCPEPLSEIQLWNWSTHVFSALVLEINQILDCKGASKDEQVCRRDRVDVSFKPMDSFKGEPPNFEKVSINIGGIAGMYLHPNTKYLLLVRESETGVWMEGCSPPFEMGSEAEEVFWKRLNIELQEQTMKELPGALDDN